MKRRRGENQNLIVGSECNGGRRSKIRKKCVSYLRRNSFQTYKIGRNVPDKNENQLRQIRFFTRLDKAKEVGTNVGLVDYYNLINDENTKTQGFQQQTTIYNSENRHYCKELMKIKDELVNDGISSMYGSNTGVVSTNNYISLDIFSNIIKYLDPVSTMNMKFVCRSLYNGITWKLICYKFIEYTHRMPHIYETDDRYYFDFYKRVCECWIQLITFIDECNYVIPDTFFYFKKRRKFFELRTKTCLTKKFSYVRIKIELNGNLVPSYEEKWENIKLRMNSDDDFRRENIDIMPMSEPNIFLPITHKHINIESLSKIYSVTPNIITETNEERRRLRDFIVDYHNEISDDEEREQERIRNYRIPFHILNGPRFYETM